MIAGSMFFNMSKFNTIGSAHTCSFKSMLLVQLMVTLSTFALEWLANCADSFTGMILPSSFTLDTLLSQLFLKFRL